MSIPTTDISPLCFADILVAALLIASPFYAVQQLAPVAHDTFLFGPGGATSWNVTLPATISSALAKTANSTAAAAYRPTANFFFAQVQKQLPASVVALLPTTSALSLGTGLDGRPLAVFSVASMHIAALLVFVAAVFAARYLWRLWRMANAPARVVRTPTKPRTSRMQKAADFPPPFPNGWFVVEHSHRLLKGQVREVQAFGNILALFRGMDGRAQVLDGICPHLGANLGVAGQVADNCLKCCFHGWEFDREGKCQKVHGTDTIPVNAFVRKYPTREVNGCIFVYYDCDGNDPTWEVEPFAPVNDGKSGWYIAGETYNVVHAHINEIPENGSDAAHLNVLHQPFVVDSLAPTLEHTWSCTWEVDKLKPYSSDIRLTQGMTIRGWRLPFGDVDAKIRQVGPGLVILNLSTVFGDLVTYESIIPTRCTSQIARHITFAAPTVPRIVGKFIMWAFEEQFHRDVPIWESKKFLQKPLISKADGPIMNYRRWMQQFYTPSSVTFADALAKEYMLDF